MIDKKCSNLCSRVRWDFFCWDFFSWLPCLIKNLLIRDTRRWLPSRQITCVQCGEVIHNNSFDILKLPPQKFTYENATIRFALCYRQIKLFSLLIPVWRSEIVQAREAKFFDLVKTSLSYPLSSMGKVVLSTPSVNSRRISLLSSSVEASISSQTASPALQMMRYCSDFNMGILSLIPLSSWCSEVVFCSMLVWNCIQTVFELAA